MIFDHVNVPAFKKSYPYFETVVYSVQFGCDALSMAIFLFGKIQYKIETTEEGMYRRGNQTHEPISEQNDHVPDI
jgi:hypothetical protein